MCCCQCWCRCCCCGRQKANENEKNKSYAMRIQFIIMFIFWYRISNHQPNANQSICYKYIANTRTHTDTDTCIQLDMFTFWTHVIYWNLIFYYKSIWMLCEALQAHLDNGKFIWFKVGWRHGSCVYLCMLSMGISQSQIYFGFWQIQ